MSVLTFRKCHLGDAPALLRLATAALATDSFHRLAFGFEPADFDAYWRAYFQMVLRDPAAEVFGLAGDGRIQAGGAVGYLGFPRADLRDHFQAAVRAACGPARWPVFARFLEAYDEVMYLPEEEARQEGQVLWLFVEPQRRGADLVARMLKEWIVAHRPASVRVLSGLVNADAPGLTAAEAEGCRWVNLGTAALGGKARLGALFRRIEEADLALTPGFAELRRSWLATWKPDPLPAWPEEAFLAPARIGKLSMDT